jgi:hypothetical protein
MHGMSRTFSLGRLMLVVTVFCVLCGLAVSFPLYAKLYLLIALLFVPTVIVWAVLLRLSSERVLLGCCVLIGALFGYMLFSPMWMSVPWTSLGAIDYLVCALPPAVGALVLGGAVVADEAGRHWKN